MMAILTPGKNCSGLFDVEDCGLIIDGRNYYRAFYEAAEEARRFILIAGWQFDSEVKLLRGDDVRETDMDMIGFFNMLCEKREQLKIYILAWDYSVLYALEREWFQKWIFRRKTHERVHFLFDNAHAVGASHHQKLVVVDGVLAFLGGMDICSSRWDDRRHLPHNSGRINTDGKSYGPYHDVQAFATGPVVDELTDIFRARWKNAGGQALDLDVSRKDRITPREPDVRINARKAGLSITEASTVVPFRESVQEIRGLYLDAIAGSERLVYLENQYFSSEAVFEAFMERMEQESRKLDIIMIFPARLKAFVEEMSLGLAQLKMFSSLRRAAREHGHSFGLYSVFSTEGDDEPQMTYIHSKVLVIDDRFLTVGSANTTNRSMALDTELNITWEAAPGNDEQLKESIRKARIDLLYEHTGIEPMSEEAERFSEPEGLVDYLNSLIDRGSCRLEHIELSSYYSDSAWFRDMDPEDLNVDPGEPVIEENIFEIISHDKSGFFAKGIIVLNRLLTDGPDLDEKELDGIVNNDAHVSTGGRSRPKLSKLMRFLLCGVFAAFFILSALILLYVFTGS